MRKMLSEKLTTTFFEELNKFIDEKPESLSALKGNNKQWAVKYIFNVMMAVVEISELQEEIELIFNDFEDTPMGFLRKTPTIDEIALTAKIYIITWATMNDLIARLVNVVFDIGIHDSDISFGIVIRNNKVKQTKIPNICKKYQKIIDIDQTISIRNDAIHRGKLADEEIVNLKRQRNKIESKRYSLLSTERITDEEYKEEKKLYNRKLKDLIEKKKAEYKKHYEGTVSLLSEIAKELANITFSNLNETRIYGTKTK